MSTKSETRPIVITALSIFFLTGTVISFVASVEKAVWWELIPSNPADCTERPTVRRKKIEVLQAEEASLFGTGVELEDFNYGEL